VFLTNLRHDGPWVEVLSEIGLPAVVYGGPDRIGDLAGVWHSLDPASAMEDTVTDLAGLGHGGLAGELAGGMLLQPLRLGPTGQCRQPGARPQD
jgi:hypothetical protein